MSNLPLPISTSCLSW